MGMSDRIKSRRNEMNLTQEELGSKLGLQKSAIAKYENGRVKNIKRSTIQKMAEILECSPAWLMGFDVPMYDIDISKYKNIVPLTTQTLPVLGSISCGEPVFMNEEREFYTKDGTKIKADYILTASGDSMINARIYDGDLVFIRIQETVENGDIAAVSIGDEATLKRFYYYKEHNLIILRAENPAYKDLEYRDEELENIRVLGKAVAFQGDVK